MQIDKAIKNISKTICTCIEKTTFNERGFYSQNILAQLRNLVEMVCLKIYSNGQDIEENYENIQKALSKIKPVGKYRFLTRFHKFLQITTSHYTPTEENSERLVLKYSEYLLKIKNFLFTNYNISVLENLKDFPIDIDTKLKEYYEKIAEKIEEPSGLYKNSFNDRYYIQKVKPFFIQDKVYYEVTFSIANDKTNKFDRIIAFTSEEILPNYAVKLSVRNSSIRILDKYMPILIIDNWDIAIRPCEFNNFAKIFGIKSQSKTNSNEYKNLMVFMKSSFYTLCDIVNSDEETYILIKNKILFEAKTSYIFDILDICRTLITEKKPGSNILNYLLYRLNNRIIKLQTNKEQCKKLSNLYLSYGTIPFDNMPYNTSLIKHNPKIYDLLDCIPIVNREHELLARVIRNNTEEKCQLYTSEEDLSRFKDLDKLISLYNSKLYITHTDRKIEKYKNFYYIKGYEKDTVNIIKILQRLSSSGYANYTKSVESWLKTTANNIDCEEKKAALLHLFEQSKVALIYGAAGTGKSTMINHISMFFNSKSKLYLANTNPAVDNLKRKVSASYCEYKTISSFLSSSSCNTEYDILFIDECSTVNNKDMLKVLEKAQFKLLVLVGDIYQIESITFGNWFTLAKDFISKHSVYELTKPFRAKKQQLLDFWTKVRNLDDDILEIITKNNYSHILNESLFSQYNDDEIVLCLNYDGLYGINNINRFLQENNPNKPIRWGVHIYKINDPILFYESERFSQLLYNNLKGKIVNIKVFDSYIQFDIEIDKVINEMDIWDYLDLKLLDNPTEGKSTIRFNVSKYVSSDEDDETNNDNIVPFQVAYAVSIHKAQGLEYSSVKIVITNELEEMISHNIFYTAITRTKEKLQIYWTPETEKKILCNMKKRQNHRDTSLLSTKTNLKEEIEIFEV